MEITTKIGMVGTMGVPTRDFRHATLRNEKGGAIALTRWIKKMESVIDNSGCTENQNVRYAASSFLKWCTTWWEHSNKFFRQEA
ncbi:hypothetical protein Tco_0373451 [Tanacetum coccineum]